MSVNPERQDLEQYSEMIEDEKTAPQVAERRAPEQLDVDSTEPKTKKSLSFKLAFIGLATSLFVFQVDATCLGIALPVSHDFPATHAL